MGQFGTSNSYFSGGVTPTPLPPISRLTPEERLKQRRATEAQEAEKESGWVSDVAMSIPRGVAGAVEGILEIPRIFGADYDIPDNFGMGRSSSLPGSLIEGVTQFMVGFLPGGFGLGHVGKAGRALKIAKGVTGARRAKAAALVAEGNKAAAAVAKVRAAAIMSSAAKGLLGSPNKQAQLRLNSFGRSMAVGAFADFAVFTHDEERLSNLLQHWGLDNPVINMLAANPEDNAAFGRFKNLLEGAGLGLAVEGIARIARNLFRRQHTLKDAGLSDKQMEKDIEGQELDSIDAAEEGTGGGGPRAPEEEVATPTERGAEEDVPAPAEVDGDLALMSYRELQEEAKRHSGLKRSGKGINTETLREAVSAARRAEAKQGVTSRAFDEQQFPERGATETAEEAAERKARGGEVPGAPEGVAHASDETDLAIGRHEKALEAEFGPDWREVEPSKKSYTDDAGKKRTRTVWAYKDPSRPVDPRLRTAIIQRNKLRRQMLRERRAEMLMGDRPKTDIWENLAHHESIKNLGHSLIRNREMDNSTVRQLVGLLDEEISAGTLTPQKIKGVVNTAMLGPDSLPQLIKVLTEQGHIKPAQFTDVHGRDIGLRTLTEKVKGKDGKVHTREYTVNRSGERVTEAEIRQITIRMLANQTGRSMKEITKKLSRITPEMEALSFDAQSLAHFYNQHMMDAADLSRAMADDAVDLRARLGLDSPEAAIKEFSRWLQEAVPMMESWGRYRREGSRAFYRLRFGSRNIMDTDLIRAMIKEEGGADHIRGIGDMLFGKDGALNGGSGGALAALRQVDRKRRIWWMINEHFINFILSGARTFSTNTLGNAITAIYGPIETLMAARAKQGWKTLTGQSTDEIEMEVLRATQEFVGLWSHLADSATMMKQAWDQKDYILDQGRGTLDIPEHQKNAWTGAGWAALRGQEYDPAKFVGQRMAEQYGRILRTPSRALMATDEFFKQLNYRTTVRADLAVQSHVLMREGRLRNPHRPVDSDFIGPQPQTMDEWVEEEMTAMTVRGQALIRDNLIREADKRFTRNDPKFQHAEGPIQLQLTKKRWIEDQLKTDMVDRGAIADRAISVARERTFTTELDQDGGFLSDMGHTLSKFSTRHPFVRLFVPFIRTPLNIFVYAARRTSIPILNRDLLGAAEYLHGVRLKGRGLDAMKSQMARELASNDPRERLDALGRMMSALGWTTGMATAAYNGLITGAGPADKDMRKVMINAGWQPYSVKIGETYYSYQKLDPLATVVGLYADLGDALKWSTEDDQSDIERLSIATAISVAHNLKSKSYLQGLTNAAGLVNDPELSVPAVSGRFLGAFMVPSIFAGFREITDDSYVEMRGVMDGLTSRIPGWSSVSLDPMRNAIGEKVDRRQFEGGAKVAANINALFNPIITNRTSSDLITNELALLEYPFSTPSRFKYGVDFTDHKNDQGRSAYDRWLELSSTTKLGGKTMRQRMERLIKSRPYQKLPIEGLARVDEDSPRIRELMKIIRAYRGAALREMLREFPAIAESARNKITARSAFQQGIPTELVRAQLFPVE